MATLNFPDDPSTGDVYKDGNSGFSYKWNGTVWISTDPSTASNIREIDDISGDFDGSDTTFTLKVAGVNVEPANVQQLIISVGGVMQNAGQDFTLSGSTLTFTTAPSASLTFFGVLLGTALSLNTVANGSVGSAALKTEDFTIGGSGNTVTIPGNLTVQGTETIINTERLDIQDKTFGIASTNAPSSISQDGAGAIIYGQTHVDILYDVDKAALGISTGVSVAGFVSATNLKIDHATNPSIQFKDSGTKQASINAEGTQTNVASFEDKDLVFAASSSSAFTERVRIYATTGNISGVAATIGTGVTVNNTGIDAGNAGIVTAGTVAAPSALSLKYGATNTAVTIDTSGDVGIGEDDPDGNKLLIRDASTIGTNKGHIMLTGDSATNGEGPQIVFSESGGTSQHAGAYIGHAREGSNSMGTLEFGTRATSGDASTVPTQRLKITSTGSFHFSNGLFDEKVNITAGKLSDNLNIDLENGMVHYFTTQEDTTATPNIRINASATLQGGMDTGDVCTVTLITTAAAAGYSANLTIDGNAVTEEWVGGEAPSEGGADGLDIYAYTIICIGTGTGDSGFKVIANLTNATN